MNYKTCKILSEKFVLDEKFNIFFGPKKKAQVIDSLEKGYIYAAMFFYDEVQKEVDKLGKVIRKHMEMIGLEGGLNADTAILLLDLTRRTKASIGDDSLDALVKEILGETRKHLSLHLEPKEIAKLHALKDSILTEVIAHLYENVVEKAEGGLSGKRTATLAQAYIEKMTERQKKLLAPAFKMIGFLNDVRIDEFEYEEPTISFQLYAMSAPFAAKEESIKNSLKKLMDANT